MGKLLWEPSEERKLQTNLTRFILHFRRYRHHILFCPRQSHRSGLCRGTAVPRPGYEGPKF